MYATYDTKPNIVRDWNKLQGMTSPTDSHIQIRRDINHRYVSVENSSPTNHISIGIVTYFTGPIPQINFTLAPGEVKALGVNTPGDTPMQFIHMIDPKTKTEVGNPYALRTDANTFVLRQGINMWWVDPYFTPGFSAPH